MPGLGQALDLDLTRAGMDAHDACVPVEAHQHRPARFHHPACVVAQGAIGTELDALDLDVTGGEQDCDFTVWRRMIDMHAVDVVQPDICYLGGISRTLRVARMAGEAGLPVTPHSANLSLVTVFTLHLMGALANAGPYVEFSIEPDEGYYPWQAGLFDPVLRVEDGRVAIPDGPGWGVEVRPEWLASATHRSSGPV